MEYKLSEKVRIAQEFIIYVNKIYIKWYRSYYIPVNNITN